MKEIQGSSSDDLVFKVLECWVFISVDLHASNVSLFRGGCLIHFNEPLAERRSLPVLPE